MGFLKFVFVLLLVVPVAVLMLYFVSNLSDKMKISIKNQKNNDSSADRKTQENGPKEKRPQLRSLFTRKKKNGAEKSSNGKKRSEKDGGKGISPERREREHDVYGSSGTSAGRDYLKDTPYYRKKQEMKAAQGGRPERSSFAGASASSGRHAESYSDRRHKTDSSQKGMSKRQRRKARKSKKKVRESQK